LVLDDKTYKRLPKDETDIERAARVIGDFAAGAPGDRDTSRVLEDDVARSLEGQHLLGVAHANRLFYADQSPGGAGAYDL
jgi:hypothetical protein